MNLQSFLALESKTVLVAVHAGQVQGVAYDAGTVGVIERIYDPAEGSGRIIRFTRSLAFDFGFFEKRNWEILKHCAVCSGPTIQTELAYCETCLRPDYCPACIASHDCLVPGIGTSRKPRHNSLTKGK